MQVAEAKQTKNTVSKTETARRGLFFQPKLTVNAPGDEYEQEADAMADKVMRMSDGKDTRETFLSLPYMPFTVNTMVLMNWMN